MISTLTIYCMGPPAETAWLATRPAIKVYAEKSGIHRIAIRTESSNCEDLIDLMKSRRQVPERFSFYCENVPEETWVGGIPTEDEFVNMSPANVFDPVLPPPCYGLVPAHVPLHVFPGSRKRPKDHIIDVNLRDTIFSEPVCRFLDSCAPCDFGEVVFSDKVLTSHRRLFPRESRNVIATDITHTVECAVCHTPLVVGPGSGFWLGHRLDDLTVCRNEQGVYHRGTEHLLIFSVDVIQKILENFRGDFGFRPILDIESPLGQRIAHLFRRIQELEAFRETAG